MLSPKFLRLAADLLDLAGERAAARICDDYDLEDRLTVDERIALAALMNRSNFGDRDMSTVDPMDIVRPDDLTHVEHGWRIMAALAHGLREDADAADAQKHAQWTETP